MFRSPCSPHLLGQPFPCFLNLIKFRLAPLTKKKYYWLRRWPSKGTKLYLSFGGRLLPARGRAVEDLDFLRTEIGFQGPGLSTYNTIAYILLSPYTIAYILLKCVAHGASFGEHCYDWIPISRILLTALQILSCPRPANCERAVSPHSHSKYSCKKEKQYSSHPVFRLF